MRNITFDFAGLHVHGSAFFDYLELRKQFFVDRLNWDVPHNQSYEMDQYDNPTAWYSLVVEDGVVLGGARVMPTTSIWGQHTYMLRDAFTGTIDSIPARAMPSEIVTPMVWECTRLVISDTLRNGEDRARCLSMIVDGLADVAQSRGATELVTLSTLSLVRALRQLGFPAERLGEPYQDPGDRRKYAVLRMPLMSPTHAIAAE
ncbi:MAG: acyl-homoserine-lactone synthase [Pseudomonadota bacterium]